MKCFFVTIIMFAVCKGETNYVDEYPQIGDINNCTTNLTNLSIQQNDLEINITWDTTTTTENCTYEYKINLVQISETSSNVTNLFTKTMYYKTDINPCSKYNITVELFEENNSEMLSNISDIFSPQIQVVKPLSSFNITPFVNSLFLEWNKSINLQLCEIHYKINIAPTLLLNDTPYFHDVTNPWDWIYNLYSCTRYNISISPISSYYIADDDQDLRLISEISTLPEKVKEINITIHQNSTEITWLPPNNKDCIQMYKITSERNNSQYTTTATTVTINETLYCDRIKIQGVTIDDYLGEATFALKPGQVDNLQILPTDTSVTVNWNPPSVEDCIVDYIIRLGTIEKDTPENEFTFYNLTACTDYDINVITRATDGTRGDPISINFKTLGPNNIGLIENLDMMIENDILDMTWDVPKKAYTCNIKYILQIHDNKNNKVFDKQINDTTHSINITSSIGCMIYTITIQPVIGANEGEIYQASFTLPRENIQPLCNVTAVGTRTATLECSVDIYENNMCSITEALLNCEAYNLNNNSDWRIRNISIIQAIKDNTNRTPIIINAKNMSEFTNYSCLVTVKNKAGNSPKSKPILFQTEEDVPTAPKIDEITDITNTSFIIKWTQPSKIPGILQKYRITVEPKMPLHFIPIDCRNKGKSPSIYEIDPPSVNMYTISELLPSFKYAVYMEAKTVVGYGTLSEQKEVDTKSGFPEEPYNVDFIVNEIEKSVNITWQYPCTNGVMKYFEITVTGFPQVDVHIEVQKYTNNISINKPIENLNYEHVVMDLQPAFDYEIKITAVMEDGQQSIPVELKFHTAESLPTEPNLKEALNVSKHTFILEWDEPLRKNGELLNYFVYVKNNGPLHWVPEDCNYYTTDYEYAISPELTNFKFENASPNHYYNATVTASTTVGNGTISNTQIVYTLEAEPEKVRNYHIQFINRKNETYNVSVLSTFKHPCHTNGALKQFNIALNGSRQNAPIHLVKYSYKKNLEQNNYNFSMKLLAEYNYILTLQVETNTHKTDSFINFLSPSGVPPSLTENIISPCPLGSTQAQYNLSRNLFDRKYGDILYYALILGEINSEEKSTYGFWDGSITTWPVVNGSSNLQVTPSLWNPFNGNLINIFTIVLGDGNLSTYNEPLQPKIVYTFKVRGFTQHGYRDSSTVVFELPEKVGNAGLIFGVIFGICVTGIVFAIIIILWRRQQMWAKNKELVKSIPLTPPSIPIKQFPEHYYELRDNAEKLRHEYTLLATKSSEIVLTMSDGLLPENKKKNRYTNIIPYDHTRVKLLNTDDNCTDTDYLNASYIQGYSGSYEYIATQGPLEHTCLDFWNMIIQENSSLIVMVAQFVEQNKEKCYKYFPNNHENMELNNGTAIRCCTELNFKAYTVRTLLVQKDLQQLSVTHLQFTDWPDFGCPVGTEIMLEFCQLMREHAARNSDPIVIHCSAGVGRTGTLIALDILLQAIDQEQDIDIFGTVLNLRQDRKNMVQTEKQYLYIHNCIHDAIKNPLPIKNGNILKEPIYENVEDIKSECNGDIIESQF